jgi:hypothetical protein
LYRSKRIEGMNPKKLPACQYLEQHYSQQTKDENNPNTHRQMNG